MSSNLIPRRRSHGSGAEPGVVHRSPLLDACDKPAVVEQAYSGRILCGKHLAKSVRKKISKELRVQLPLVKGQHTTVLVAVSGGKDSAVLLDAIVELLGKRRDVTVVAGTVDEGIEGYRPPFDRMRSSAVRTPRCGAPRRHVPGTFVH